VVGVETDVLEDVAQVEPVDAARRRPLGERLERFTAPLEPIEVAPDLLPALGLQRVRQCAQVAPSENPLHIGVLLRIGLDHRAPSDSP
jgi:hypothetical protein